jgi:molecular chaperone DnaJ
VQEGDSPEVQQAIDLINHNQNLEAQRVLTFIPSADRDARWYYLSALANYVAADFLQAADNMTKACQLDTMNQEYQQLLWYFQQAGQNYEKKPKNFLITPLIPIAGIIGYVLGKLFLGN